MKKRKQHPILVRGSCKIIYINTVRFFGTLRSDELQKGSFQDRHFQKAYNSAFMETPLFLLNASHKSVTKQVRLKTDSVASSGHQGKLTHFIYFACPPFEAELSILIYRILFTC